MKIPAQLFRSADFQRDSINTADRTVYLSVSSDLPYQRFFGTEILSHKSEAVRLKRLKSAGSLLFNHHHDQHLGRILSADVDGKKLSVVAKFGSGKLASEKFQDVQDGILREASIGYEIHKMEQSGDKKTFTAIDWEPYEASLVTVPADATVGMGRQREKEVELSVPDSLVRETNGATDLSALVADAGRVVGQGAANSLLAWLNQNRTLIKGGQRGVGVTFAKVGPTVIKVVTETIGAHVEYNIWRNHVNYARQQETVSIWPASEADLLDAQVSVKRGADQIVLREFLRIVRNEPAPPLEIKIVNANELAPAKFASIKRDSEGKLSGLVVQSIPGPA